MGILMQVALVFVTILTTGLAGVSFSAGPCSNGVKPGGSWYEPGCIKCFCYNGGFECQSCGIAHIQYNRKKCYLESDRVGLYPSCCLPVVVCPGDRRFKPDKLAKALKISANKKLKESNLRRVQAAKKKTARQRVKVNETKVN
ncbi:uncharacterized protein LOC131949274 [Physella acuta]|uniref:uncharacterized protein LOC131949274 n=1 Tax=Physella acuta TaxID=109671 RepID=UPI0027DCFE52|nr:uncharacterized protein LOC131949274 [Physella acuta]